jgi:hypothetical protein
MTGNGFREIGATIWERKAQTRDEDANDGA